MPYTITLSNGSTQISVADDAIDNSSTSISLVGRNASGYGQPIEADLVHMLENWAATTAPTNPLLGQLWYDTDGGILNVCTALSPATWTPLASASEGGSVTSVVGLTGAITLSQLQGVGLVTSTQLSSAVANLAPIASPNFSGVPTTPTPDGSNSAQVATVGFVQSQASTATTSAVTQSEAFATNLVNNLHARTVLQTSLNLYVSPSGNDANNGLSSGTPFRTLQHAWNVLVTGYDLNGFGVTINLAAGTYTSGCFCYGYPPGISAASGGITFTGASSNPDATVVSVTNTHCFFFGFGCTEVTLQNMRLGVAGSTNSGNCITTSMPENYVVINNIDFGPSAGAHMYCNYGQIMCDGRSTARNYTISGSAQYHLLATNYGFTVVWATTITITGNPSFTQFINCQISEIDFISNSISGTATGPRYFVANNGLVFTSGGYTSLPGNSAGSLQAQGQIS